MNPSWEVEIHTLTKDRILGSTRDFVERRIVRQHVFKQGL